ncbi:hypothetical protein Tco_0789619, partial [Tanacetum coccineum]
MYKVHTRPNQTRITQLPQDSRKTNKCMSFSTGVTPTTSVSRPQLKSNHMEDRVMHNNSQRKKQEVEDYHRNFKFSNNKTSCVLNDNHDMYVLHYINGVNSRTKQPIVVPISTREPERTVNQYVATPLKRTVTAESTKQKPRSIIRKQYEQISTVKFGNDQIAPILVFGDLVQGTITIKRGNDLLTGSRGTYLYSITLQDLPTPNLIFLMAKATSSQACKKKVLSKLDYPEFQKTVTTSTHGLMRYTWTHFLRSKDETPEVLIDFLTLIQRGLHAQVRTVRTDKGTKFLNKTLHAYFAKEGIRHETSIARTPEQNGVVERQNRTLVEAARTMLSAAKVPLFFWAEAIATTCFTQNRSLVIPRHEKTPYHIINGRKPSIKFFHIFGSLCYIVKEGENLDKMKEKGDACIFVGYSTQSRAYRVFNKRTRVLVETIHVNFDELPHMASDHVSSDPVPECPTTVLEQDSLSPGPQSQDNVPKTAKTVRTSNEMDLLFSPMFDELLNGTTLVVSKSSVVHAADANNKRQQNITTQSSTTTDVADAPPLNIQTTPQTTNQAPTQEPTVT